MSKPERYTGYETARRLRISQTRLVELVRQGYISGFSRNLTPLIIKDGHRDLEEMVLLGKGRRNMTLEDMKVELLNRYQIIDDSAEICSASLGYNERLSKIKKELVKLRKIKGEELSEEELSEYEHTFIAPGPPAYEEILTKFWEKQSCEWQFKIEDVLDLEKKLYPECESVVCSEGSTKGLLSPCEGATTDTNLESVVKELIVAEGKALKNQNGWTIPRIAEEIANNDKIKQRLGCGDLAQVTIVGYLKGHGIGKRGRPKAPMK